VHVALGSNTENLERYMKRRMVRSLILLHEAEEHRAS